MSNTAWPTKPLSQLSSRIGDGIHGTPIYTDGEGYPFVNGNNLKSGSIEITASTKRVSKEEYEKYAIEFDEQTLFMSINGTLGNLAKYKGEKMVLGKSAAYIKCTGVDVDFLYYYFQLREVKALMWNVATGSTIKNLSLASIRNLDIPTPPGDLGTKIAGVLLAIDRKIELNTRINAELEVMAKTVYDYLFVQFDFPDVNGKPYKTSGGKMVYNPTLNREIPEGWDVRKLVDLCSVIRRGISPRYTEEGGTSVLNQKCVREQRISFEDSRRHQVELDDKDDRLLQPFDVVVNSTGVGTLGRVAFVKRLLEKKTTVDSHVTIVRANGKFISPQYLAWVMMRYQPAIESAANGSTGQVELSKSYLQDIDVVIPPKNLTLRFSDFVNPIVQQMAARESENEHLVSLRDWLLPMLMNGQLTVTSSTQPSCATA